MDRVSMVISFEVIQGHLISPLGAHPDINILKT